MDLIQELVNLENSQWEDQCSRYVLENRSHFRQLMETFLKAQHQSNYRLNQRCSALILRVVKTHCEWLDEWIEPMAKALYPDQSTSMKRNILRIFQYLDLPAKVWGHTADQCFTYLQSTEPVAIKVFAMTVLHRLSENLPDIKSELRIILEDQYPYASAGFRARADKIIPVL